MTLLKKRLIYAFGIVSGARLREYVKRIVTGGEKTELFSPRAPLDERVGERQKNQIVGRKIRQLWHDLKGTTKKRRHSPPSPSESPPPLPERSEGRRRAACRASEASEAPVGGRFRRTARRIGAPAAAGGL